MRNPYALASGKSVFCALPSKFSPELPPRFSDGLRCRVLMTENPEPMYAGPWRNGGKTHRSSMLINICSPQELKEWDHELYLLLVRHGSMFDDRWYYWISTTGRWVRRTPVLIAQKRMDSQKPRKYEPNRKLEDFPH